MRHLGNLFLIYLVSVIVSISQFFITGVYGKIVFWPLLGVLSIGYLIMVALKESKNETN